LPRKTDSKNPADWIYFAESDLEGLRVLCQQELSYHLCQSKLAEALEKIVKAELIRLGWPLVKTHDLQSLAQELQMRKADIHSQASPLCTALAECYFIDRYPGFDLEEKNWTELRSMLDGVAALLAKIKARV